MTTSRKQARGERSRELILDTAERLMAGRGYSGTAMSAICRETGLPATSIYWHFGSKQGLLAAVMERGARRWFAALPDWDDTSGETADQQAARLTERGADAVTEQPAFLRLFYLLALDSADDPEAAALVRQVRDSANQRFRRVIEGMLAAEHPPEVAGPAAEELARFAVACSDGCFFALQLEPGETDARRMFADLFLAVRALAPAAIHRAQRESR